MGQKFRRGLAGRLRLRFFHGAAVKMLSRAAFICRLDPEGSVLRWYDML